MEQTRNIRVNLEQMMDLRESVDYLLDEVMNNPGQFIPGARDRLRAVHNKLGLVIGHTYLRIPEED